MTDDRTRAPRVDTRATETLVAQVEALLVGLTDGAWMPAGPGDSHDPLGALARVFGDMAGQLLDGINAVPDAAFGAFLRLIGVEAQRPAPARAPLTFRLADGAPVDGVVPAGTQVGASAADDDHDPAPIVFETEEELVVTRARLVAACAHDPALDRLDLGPLPLRAFDPVTPGVHELCIACPAILGRGGAHTWTVRLEFAGPPAGLELAWFGDGPEGPLALAAELVREGDALTATLPTPPVLASARVGDHNAAWLTARLSLPGGAQAALPELRRVTLAATFAASDVAPEKVLRGATVLDATAEFHPFDRDAGLGAACALDGGVVLAQEPGADVAVDIVLAAAAAAPQASADLVVAWELRDPTGAWIELGRASGTDPALPVDGHDPHGLVDDSHALTRPGRVRFRLPFTVAEARHHGKVGRWLRVRVVAGGYLGGQVPVLGPVRLGFTHAIEAVVADRCLARDLGHVRDLGVLDGAHPAQLHALAPADAPALGARPALYLGFDRPFEPRTLRLFLDVLAPDPAQTAPPEQLPPPREGPRVDWEYLGAGGWTRLGVRDGTAGLRQRGIVTFLAPADAAVTALFGRDGVWLRARWVAGSFRAPPRVAAARLNTVWAVHAATHHDEVLGSGTGAPGQRLRLVAAPVLADERIEIRERDVVSERDVLALRAELGDDLVTVERDVAGALTAAWVRWRPVTHFHASGPADRHYVLDADRGELRFGDGLAGRAPPRGRGNVRAAFYRTGGGLRGNRPAGAVTGLKTTIPYVDGVTNAAPAAGGAAREDDARARARGPRQLRHRGRAVTASDLEDLAFEASSDVARAHALTGVFNPIDVAIDLGAPNAGALEPGGWVVGGDVPDDTAEVAGRAAEVRVVVVPHADVAQPVPSLGLLEQVDAYLRARNPPAMRLHVSGPRWIRVTVEAAVVPAPDAAAEALLDAMRAEVTRFLHPLHGGEHGHGWDFGRIPRRSHLYRLLARFPGVHHLESLVVRTDPPLPAGSEPLSAEQRRALAGALVYSGAHALTLVGVSEED